MDMTNGVQIVPLVICRSETVSKKGHVIKIISHFSRDSLSVNFIPYQDIEKMEASDFFYDKLGQ